MTTHSICATSGPSSPSPRRTVVTHARGAHTFTPTLTWYRPRPGTSSPPAASVIANGPACANRYVAGRVGYAALAYVGSPCSSTSLSLSGSSVRRALPGRIVAEPVDPVLVLVGLVGVVVVFSGTRPRRELARRPSMESDRRELIEPGRDSAAAMNDVGVGTGLPVGVDAALCPPPVAVVFAFAFEFLFVSPPAAAGVVGVLGVGAGDAGPVSCRRPSRIDSARLRSSEMLSTLERTPPPSLSEGASLEELEDGAEGALALLLRKSAASRTRPERRPLWRNRENRCFLPSSSSGEPGVGARAGVGVGDEGKEDGGGFLERRKRFSETRFFSTRGCGCRRSWAVCIFAEG